MGVTGVPTFIIAGQYVLTGAQPVEVWEDVRMGSWRRRRRWCDAEGGKFKVYGGLPWLESGWKVAGKWLATF